MTEKKKQKVVFKLKLPKIKGRQLLKGLLILLVLICL
jgi:hypothetical protein